MRRGKRILVIDGHPDPDSSRFVHALVERYATGALQSGHFVETVRIASLGFNFLATREDVTTPHLLDGFRQIRDNLIRCDHVVIAFPVWLGSMPAKLQGFLEHLMRRVVGYSHSVQSDQTHNVLHGKSGRLVMTMTMPVDLSMSLMGIRCRTATTANYLGLDPLHTTIFGNVDVASDRRRRAMLKYMWNHGCHGL